MAFEDETKQSIKELRDNQIVQGVRLHRTEENLDRLEGVVEQLADGMILLQAAMKDLAESVEGLSATVERFIRGMERNGHHPSGGGS